MKQQAPTTRFSTYQLADAKKKIKIYLSKLLIPAPHTKLEKICHLASQTFLKFADNDEFSKQVFTDVQSIILDKKCYYGLYLFDMLLKNHRTFMRSAKKQLERSFKVIFEKVASQVKNGHKIECLKAMARTWAVIYGQKYEENIKKWLDQNYKDNLTLSDKNQQIFKEAYEKYRANKNNTSTNSNKVQMLLKQMNQPAQDNIQHLKLLDALQD